MTFIKSIKVHIGVAVAQLGIDLWMSGGGAEAAEYEHLTYIGKLGYNIYVRGMLITGVTKEDMDRYRNGTCML